MKKSQISLYFIVIGAFLLFISGNFLSEGLSRVGLDNALVSQRMAEGFDSFWLPSIDTPGTPDRSNYLPLGYWLGSWWYKAFGTNTFMAEKIYSLLTYLIVALLMIWVWKLTGRTRRSGWLPLVCWIMMPIVSWSATNNLLETTMTIFIMLSVAFLFKAQKAQFLGKTLPSSQKRQRKNRFARYLWVIVAALMMELAFMIKGFAGLFPIFFPFFYWLLVRRERIIYPIINTVLILVVWMVTLFIVVILSPTVYDVLYNYIHNQMIGGVLYVQTVTTRFWILHALVLQGAIPLAIAVIICLIRIKHRPFYRFMFYWRHKDQLTVDQAMRARTGWFFLCFGLSGLLPIMLGLKQQEFYLVPTLPFFALAMACLMYDILEDWVLEMDKVAHYVLMGLAVLLFGSGLILNISNIHKINTNKELLEDMQIILPYLESGETVLATHEIVENPEVAEYFYRYKDILLDTGNEHEHLLAMYSRKQIRHRGTLYVKVDIPSRYYNLYVIDSNSLKRDAIVDSVMMADSLAFVADSLALELSNP